MAQFLVVGFVFVFSLFVDSLLTRWASNKILGVKVTIVQSGVIVLGRSASALLAGFAIGVAISMAFGSKEVDVTTQVVQIGGMLIVALFSFLAYWALLGKFSGMKISAWGATKTIATENAVLFVCVLSIAIIFSIMFTFFEGFI